MPETTFAKLQPTDEQFTEKSTSRPESDSVWNVKTVIIRSPDLCRKTQVSLLYFHTAVLSLPDLSLTSTRPHSCRPSNVTPQVQPWSYLLRHLAIPLVLLQGSNSANFGLNFSTPLDF